MALDVDTQFFHLLFLPAAMSHDIASVLFLHQVENSLPLIV